MWKVIKSDLYWISGIVWDVVKLIVNIGVFFLPLFFPRSSYRNYSSAIDYTRRDALSSAVVFLWLISLILGGFAVVYFLLENQDLLFLPLLTNMIDYILYVYERSKDR